MMKFLSLLSIENTKMWKRLSTKVMFLIAIGIVILATSVVRYHQYSIGEDVHKAPAVQSGWQTELTQEIAQANKQIDQIDAGKNNFGERTMVGSLKMSIATDQYRLDHNIGLNKPNSIWTKITDFDSNANYGYIIALMLIISCAAAVAGEFSEGTIKMAISRPYSRMQILSAKLLVTLFYGLLMLVAILVTNFLMFAVFYGIHGFSASEMLYTGSGVLYIPAFVKMLAVFGLDFLQVIFFVSLAFALSAVTRSRSLATGFSLFMLLVGTSIAQMVALYFSWGRYLPFTMTNFSGFLTQGSVIEGTSLAMALILSGIYAVAIAAAGYVTFAKRDI